MYGKTKVGVFGFLRESYLKDIMKTLPDWKLVYLALNIEAAMADNWLLWLAHVDEDEAPELFFYANDVQFIVLLLTCENEMRFHELQSILRNVE